VGCGAVVRRGAAGLRGAGRPGAAGARIRCFYDADEQIDLWGKYLAEELPVIYGEQAAAVVVFVSAEYAARDWTWHERLCRSKIVNRSWWRLVATKLVRLPSWAGWCGGYRGRGAGGVRECAARPLCRAAAFSA
jgi:hypothetical protein